MNYSRNEKSREAFIAEIVAEVEEMANGLYEWLDEEARTLEMMEEEVVGAVRRLGQILLQRVCETRVPRYPAPSVPCSCGGEADYVCRRAGKTKTQLDWIQLKRPYYLCSQCHQGRCPVDTLLGFCAGGISSGLDGLLAYVGTLLAYEEASQLLERVLGMPISASRVRYSSERLGDLVAKDEESTITAAWQTEAPQLPTATECLTPLYISMDGIKVHTREAGWKEQRLGAVYSAEEVTPRTQEDEPVIRANSMSYFTAMGDVEHFGQGLWVEAQRRGLEQAEQVIVIGDGAQWIWRLAQEHFPQATQILDWYHVTEYVWQAAHAIYGDDNPLGKRWARKQLDDLWEGRTQKVIRHLRSQEPLKPVVDAIRYFQNNRRRMRYPEYRAQGFQIGSGTIESGCKHVIAQRFKQAGMRWSMPRLQTVAKLRCRLKSHRWQETLDLRPPPSRVARCKAA